MSSKEYPSIDYVRQCFLYDDGRLFWLERPRDHFRTEHGWKVANGTYPGKEAGVQRSGAKPRWIVNINGLFTYRSIIVWTVHNGEWPKWPMEIDHKDRNQLNDRIENLRVATINQNGYNKGILPTNTSGYKGVSWNSKTKKWKADIRVNGKRLFLGYFSDPVEAHAVYVKAALEHHGEFACVECKK